MADPLGSITDAATNELALIVGIGVGLAVQSALAPAATDIAQATYNTNPGKALDADTVAAIVAENVQLQPWGEDEARLTGISKERFDNLLGETLNGPGFGELLRMLRRDSIGEDDFAHGLRKAKLETLWDAPLETLQDEYLDPALIATAIQRGQMTDPGYLPVDLDYTGSTVPPPTVSPLDPVTEAKASGINSERLAVEARLVGLPPAPGELMSLLNRGTINEAAFNLGVSQGNTRNEWASVLMTLKRRLLTPLEYQEAALRGVIENDAADTGSALSGMEAADAQLLFQIIGRPLAVHQITTGLQRGGTYGGTYDDIPEPYRDAVRRSSIRPEYAVLAYANRFTVPSYFILKAILADGGMTPDQFAQYGKELGWPPDLADAAAKALSTGSAAKADPWIAKAETQLWTAAHKAYVDDLETEEQTRTNFTEIGVTDAAQTEVIRLWNAERQIRRANLTVKQIQNAIGQPNHGVAWATQLLTDQGYNADEIAALIGPTPSTTTAPVTPTA